MGVDSVDLSYASSSSDSSDAIVDEGIHTLYSFLGWERVDKLEYELNVVPVSDLDMW